MIEQGIVQRTTDWYRARLGNITGSRCADLLKAGRKKEEVFGETAKTYLYQLAAERTMNPSVVSNDDLFNTYLDTIQVSSRAMRFGTEQEDNAKALFETLTHLSVCEVSSCRHDTIPHFAASPDGVILDEDGRTPLACIEVKCPEQKTYIKYANEIKDAETLKAVKPEYYWQVMAEMECTDTDICYFVAYCPWQTHPIHIAPIKRVQADIDTLIERIMQANQTIQKIIDDGNKQQQSLQTILNQVQPRQAHRTIRVA